MIDFWIKQLHLEEWEIVVKVRKGKELTLEEVQGEISYHFVGMQAIIGLLDPSEWPNEDFVQDIEKTLVHELLHLKFDRIATKDPQQHQLLDQIAKVLVTLKRTSNLPTQLSGDSGADIEGGHSHA